MVSIILVCFNSRKWLKKCFDSIFTQDYKNFEVIMVDNASEDGSAEFVERNYPQVRVIKNKTNLGFGAANNIGANASKGRLLFMLNTDTKIPRNALSKLVEFKLSYGFDLVGPRLLDSMGNDPLNGGFMGMNFIGSGGGPSEKLFFIDGCAILIERKDFLMLGGFDEKYHIYSEDVDLGWRAHLSGMTMEVCEDARITHFGGGTSKTTIFKSGSRHIVPVLRRYEAEKNVLRNLLKNYSWENVLWTVPFFIIQNSLESMLYFFTGNFRMFNAIWKGFAWNFEYLGDTLRERRKVQEKRKVGDWIVISRMDGALSKVSAFLHMGMPEFQ